MDNRKVEIKVSNGHEFAEIVINGERIASGGFHNFSALDVREMLQKLGIAVDYSDTYDSAGFFRLFPKYKKYLELAAKKAGQSVKEYVSSEAYSRKMLAEVIETEIVEQYAFENNLDVIPIHNIGYPSWQYEASLGDVIDETRRKELYNIIAPKILSELGLE
jgi:hypothetical protein